MIYELVLCYKDYLSKFWNISPFRVTSLIKFEHNKDTCIVRALYDANRMQTHFFQFLLTGYLPYQSPAIKIYKIIKFEKYILTSFQLAYFLGWGYPASKLKKEFQLVLQNNYKDPNISHLPPFCENTLSFHHLCGIILYLAK